jgi:hypothetical protein
MSIPITSNSDFSLISRIRRNHGLEHATLHVLSERHPRRSMAGYSDWRGFWILGEVPIDDVQSAIQEAQRRLANGERELAMHPNCGTNFVVSGMLAGLGAFLALFGVGQRKRDWLERLPLAATMATLALILAQPLGFLIQERLTTSPDGGDMQVLEISLSRSSPLPAYRVLTRG